MRFLGSRWFLSFIGVVLLSLLLWWFGPFLSFLGSWIVRGAVIAAMLLIWLGVNFWLDRRRKKNDAALVAGVAAAPQADPSIAASAEEVAAMREKLTTALTLLKKASGSRGYLYEQPWYAIIGPPGAGKTTALLNAGLKFPLAAEMGQAAVAGVGGTRMCDWWFTEDAVLIDTAGRYTTQDSDAAVDKAGWDAFLNLLKRTRTRQPLNGVMVAIALSDIAAAPQHERLAHARAIRRRVKELSDQLGVKVPVYALFTKADLVAGFMEFFDDLDRERRGQVWGMTFPLNKSETGTAAAFATEFSQLVQRLNERLLDRLQAERSPDKRTAIAGFPAQVASLQAPLAEFVAEAFGGSRLDPAPFLRGIYLTSGTQEGSPIDRLTGAMARSFGIDAQRAPTLRPEQGRSYFLARLLKDVVFGEATLVSRDPSAVRRGRLAYIGVATAAVLVAVLGAGALIQTRMANSGAVARSDAALAAYIKAAQALPLDPVTDANLPAIVPVLDMARALPFGADGGPAPTQFFPGLDQTAKLGEGARQVYIHALDNILLPRLIVRLESQMRQNFNNPAFLYEATRIYLMLGSAGPLDRDSVKAWMHFDWAAAWPGPTSQPLRDSLERHLAALLDQPLPKVSLDGALVEDARRTFSRVSLAERVYASIQHSAQATALPPWRPSDALGATGVRVFVRRSGVPMTDGIPGFYTVDGFYKVLLPQLPAATRQVASESWVLGKQSEIDPSSPQVLNLQNDVVKLYTADYARHWDALLNDIDVEPLTNMQQAVQDLYVLSSPQSPMRDLLASITRQLTLTQPPPPAPGVAGAAGAAQAAASAAAAKAAGGTASSLKGLFGQTAGPAPEPPGKAIEDRYAALIGFVGKGPGAPIDGALKLLNDLQQQLAQVANAGPGGAAPPAGGADPAQLLQTQALQDPQPVQRWLAALALSGNSQRSAGSKAAAAQAFNAPGGPASLCKQAVTGRYPFTPGAPNAIPLDDFARLFGPNGMINQFFNQQLRPFVDTSGATWTAQPVAGVAPPVSPGNLAQFQRAATIGELFFAGGGAQPSVRFDITPETLDSGALQVTLELGGQTITYAHGPQRATSVTWPGANGMGSARLVFEPAPTGGGVLQATGPWALFRLFDQGSLQEAGSSDRYTLTFHVGNREASFEIRAGSVLNPFAPGMLHDFKCPGL
ncbi:MAG TPA: type VI secretion system membrane subunit TssM [Acetobacteraceae bacterium]|nr:type VI secretion system membrane subunit TssM [Acetobacteraceae bacterium]